MSWFYNLRISTKLRLSFGVLLVLIIGVGYSGYFGMMNIIPNFDSMYKDRLVPSIQFYRMLKNVNEIRLQAIRHINTNDSSEMQRIEEIIKVLQSDFNKNLEEYAATYLVREEVENLAKLRKDLIQFNNALAKELTASRALLREDALKLHLG
ncbi:MAG: MCP four helix bundle domain-containing protein, partial [Candidatus Kapaibacteriota bacterium]